MVGRRDFLALFFARLDRISSRAPSFRLHSVRAAPRASAFRYLGYRIHLHAHPVQTPRQHRTSHSRQRAPHRLPALTHFEIQRLFRQGTASAVPKNSHASGVSTPEVPWNESEPLGDEFLGFFDSRREPCGDPPSVRKCQQFCTLSANPSTFVPLYTATLFASILMRKSLCPSPTTSSNSRTNACASSGSC